MEQLTGHSKKGHTLPLYERRILNRSKFRYYAGLIARWKVYLHYERNRRIARKNGAIIGEEVIIPRELAKMANKNLIIGAHSSIMTTQLDLRNPITFGKHVIMGASCKILTTSHEIDSPDFEVKNGGIIIEDYVWIPAKIVILPSCRRIGRGAVISSGSCVVKDVEPMSVVGGNPAKEFKKRKCVHSNLVVESLQGGDYHAYKEIWNKHKN